MGDALLGCELLFEFRDTSVESIELAQGKNEVVLKKNDQNQWLFQKPPLGFADWGQLIALAQKWIQGPPGEPFAYWYVTLFPGLCIVLYSVAWNLLGDALSEAFDPRNR